MLENIIEVRNLSKIYKLYDKPLDRLKESLNPFGKRYSKDFYALNDISFDVKKGESIGVVGKNGSGKSTLLKILTGVLAPTSGVVNVNGKIAALLELGAGFNPELSGIENIYLHGTIMGFTRKEMDEKLDDILSFSDIGDFITQPVKSYSSGMLVRVAFAVQTQVEPDILIVDEALAVGDSLFQKRCFQKISELLNNGTTLFFVSHDQETIRTLTSKSILLSNGKIYKRGTSAEVVFEYRKLLHEDEKKYWQGIVTNYSISRVSTIGKDEKYNFGDYDAEIDYVKVCNDKSEETNVFYPKDKLNIVVGVKFNKDLENVSVALRIRNKEGIKIYSWGTLNQDIDKWNAGNENNNDIIWDKKFKKNTHYEFYFSTEVSLGPNLYEIQASITEEKDRFYEMQRMLHWMDEAAFFQVVMAPKEYFFGGICDMKMTVKYSNQNTKVKCDDIV